MNLNVKRVDVWVANNKDKPGGLAKILTELREVGADLEFILARRAPEEPDTGVVFLTPLRSDAEIAAASMLGFNLESSVQSVRIEGDNEPGIAALITEKIAAEGINLRGLSAAVMGARFIIYIGLDSATDAIKVVNILQQA